VVSFMSAPENGTAAINNHPASSRPSEVGLGEAVVPSQQSETL
jgi:hypothetical protein